MLTAYASVSTAVEAIQGTQQQDVLIALDPRAVVEEIRDGDRRSPGDEAGIHSVSFFI